MQAQDDDPTRALRLVFAGTPAFAAEHLQALVQSRHHVSAVYTQPDRAAGRGKKLQPSPVKAVALEHDIPVLQPPSLKTDSEQLQLAELNPDLFIVVAYGLLLPESILETPRYGCINVHASLLPRWRGAAPIERAILAGDEETGVTIMQMDAGLDTGAMLLKSAVAIGPDDDRESLEAKLAKSGRKALLECLDGYQHLRAAAEKQDDSLGTYARKLDKSEALINWKQSASLINRQIRAGIGRAPAYSLLHGERVRFLRADVSEDPVTELPGTILSFDKDSLRVACAGSALEVECLQLPGKKPLLVRELLNSRRTEFAPGQRFVSDDAAKDAPKKAGS